MKLDIKSIEDLREVIAKEIGIDATELLNDEEINAIGVFLLTIYAEALKSKAREMVPGFVPSH